MKKYFWVAIAATALLVGCTTNQATQSPSSSPTPTESVPKCDYSPLTNECFESENPVLLVKIDDVSAARPQIGLNTADVIVVEPVEAGLTRLMAIFNSTYPLNVGPVRSARITDIDIAAAFGQPGFAYSGSTSKLVPYLTDSSLQLVGAPQGGEGYFRDDNRYAPHNYIAEVSELIQRIENVTAARLLTTQPWQFGEYSEVGKSPLSVEVVWASSSKEFFWNPQTQLWEIWADGEQTLSVNDAGELEPATAKTVFIQQTNLLDSPFVFSNGAVTPYAETYGAGKGWVLRAGQSFYANWSRPNLTDLPLWRDKSGAEIRFEDGNVWWLVAPYGETKVDLKLPKPKPTASPSSDTKPNS